MVKGLIAACDNPANICCNLLREIDEVIVDVNMLGNRILLFST